MSNILKILSRFNIADIRQRLLLMYMIIQNVVLALIVLIFANVIISNAEINGELDYSNIKMFYSIAIVAMFIIVYVFSPLILSREMIILYKDNTIEHFLSAKISISEIIYAVYFRGLMMIFTLLVSSFPIIVVSFYFGGFSIFKIIKLLIFVLNYASFLPSVCLFISTRFLDETISIIVSYAIGALFTCFNLYFLNMFLDRNFLYIIYLIISVMLSLILVSISKNTDIFYA